MKGILFDLPQVLQGARERIEKLAMSDRIETVSGDFFKAVPAADGYIMKHIIHDWDDAKATTILKHCASHLKPGGKVILVQAVLSPGNEPHLGRYVDIEMFMMPGGKERTEAEFRDLFAGAGLRLNRLVPTNLHCLLSKQ